MDITILTTILEEQKLNIPQTVIDTFIEHYKNQDTWLCCCQVTKRIYGDNHTSRNRDNLIVAIKKLKSGIWENDSLNLQGIENKSGRQKKRYFVSYDAFKKLCIQHNPKMYDYYEQL